jgi:hypothetical protein
MRSFLVEGRRLGGELGRYVCCVPTHMRHGICGLVVVVGQWCNEADDEAGTSSHAS